MSCRMSYLLPALGALSIALSMPSLQLMLLISPLNLPNNDQIPIDQPSDDVKRNNSSNNYYRLHKYPAHNASIILPRILAIYFPQFHQDPLNDRLWGKGYTDWDSLRDAPEKNRLGYRVLRPTSEFGYYDLRNTTIRKMQGELARKFGVDGFVYHHYWFYDDAHPGPTLHAPLTDMLQDGHPDIPFCLNWVAENWTSTWYRSQNNGTLDSDEDDTQEGAELLQRQFIPNDRYDPKITAHYQWLRQFFHHKNYIKVQGKPVFMLYRSSGVQSVVARLKELAVEDGFPGLFCPLGQYSTNDDVFRRGRKEGMRESLEGANAVFDRLTDYPFPFPWAKRRAFSVPQWCQGRDVSAIAPAKKLIGIMTSFDNTPRREYNSSRVWMAVDGGEDHRLRTFRKSLESLLSFQACCYTEGGMDQFVLINAWNEWGEGMALEPSNVYGIEFLKIVKQVKESLSTCHA